MNATERGQGPPRVRRIGISTGGGDAPGLNAVIRAAVKTALNLGWEVVGIRRGLDDLFPPGMAEKLTARDVAGILIMGGTILGTTNRGNPFEYRVKVGGEGGRQGQVRRQPEARAGPRPGCGRGDRRRGALPPSQGGTHAER